MVDVWKKKLLELGVQQDRLHYIPNWIDEESVQPVAHPSNSFRLQKKWKEKFVIFYGGNIGNAQYYDDILNVALALKHNEDIHFLFVGSGSKENIIDQFAISHELENLERIDLQHENHSLSEILSAGDVHFISLKSSCTGLAVPSKTYASLAVGRPIIYQGDSDGEIFRLVVEQEVGYSVEIDNVELLTEHILKLSKTPDLVDEMGNRSRSAATSDYRKIESATKYCNFLTSL